MAYLQKFEDEHGKIGYKNESTVIVECKYDDGVYSFGRSRSLDRPYGVVIKSMKCGVIDENGQEVIPCEYDEVRYLFSDLFAVRRNITQNVEELSLCAENHPKQDGWEYGVINSKLEIIIPFKYKFIERIGSMIRCYKNAISSRKYSFKALDIDGYAYDYKGLKDEYTFNAEIKMISTDHILYSCYDYLVITRGDKVGVIDSNGKKILSCKYDEIICAGKESFIVRINNDEEWVFGVVNTKEESIIPFEFKYIKSEFGSFFHCYKQCCCEINILKPIDKRYEYSNLSLDECRNSLGKIIVNGEFHALNKDYVVHISNGKAGVYNQNGLRVLNYIYDEIALLGDCFVIRIDDKIGLLDNNGGLIINCSYSRIECACPNNKKYDGIHGKCFGNYNNENIFDTDSSNTKLHHVEIRNNEYHSFRICINDVESFDFKKVFILDSDNHCELFTIEDGILSNSRYDKIQLLTETSFAVCKDAKWGVYRADLKEEIIPCIHDRLKFQGFKTVRLCIGNLWGAETLDFPSLFRTKIPIQYLEIETLDSSEEFFSVKIERKNYKDEKYEDFTIISKYGVELPCMADIRRNFNSHFKYYTYSLVLAKSGERYGFINLNGYICIPFKYDEIEDREDESFNVRIDKSWGVLHRNGMEMPTIKYAEKLPKNYENCIVKDQMTNCLGILNKSGMEEIPSVFEHLEIGHLEISDNSKEFIFFGFGGYEDDSTNFFSNISYGTWGCLRKSGEKLIEAKYDCFKIQGEYILGGRDGSMLGEGQHGYGYYESEYSGVYDLYDSDGKLLIGGFREFIQDTLHNLFMFKFGGEWKQDCEDYDKWGNSIDYYSYHFEKGNSRWLVVDHNFNSVMLQKDGEKKCFLQHIGTITKKKEGNSIVNYWNMPLELFSINEPQINPESLICGDDHEQYIVRISDGVQSSKYRRIKMINQNMFFYSSVEDNSLVGIAELSENIHSDDIQILNALDKNTFVLTHPVNGYVFGMSNINDNVCQVVLYNIYRGADYTLEAIKRIDKSELVKMVKKGYFLLYQEDKCDSALGVCVVKKDIFDEDFQTYICEVNITPLRSNVSNYWYSEDNALQDCNNDECMDDGYPDDQRDYMRDTWDAMTDGMYGDMPDGFDGDFSFLGKD